jgi:hypothetical protein
MGGMNMSMPEKPSRFVRFEVFDGSHPAQRLSNAQVTLPASRRTCTTDDSGI